MSGIAFGCQASTLKLLLDVLSSNLASCVKSLDTLRVALQ